MAQSPIRVAIMMDLQWPFKRHTEIFAGVQTYAKEQGWTTIIDEFIHDTLSKKQPVAERYDGIVARVNHPLIKRAAQRKIPVVNVWPSSPARNLAAGVYPDSTEVGRIIAEHLMARGFRRFATITSPKNIDNELEVSEFQKLITTAGFECQSFMIPQHTHQDLSHWRKSVEILESAMNQWTLPIGVYAGQEVVGRMIVQSGHRRGWRIPQDVAVIAGKNQESLCEQPHPSLTSIEIGYDRIGYKAAELLNQMMKGESAPSQPIRVSSRGLIVRESTDFFAVDHPIVAKALAYISSNSHRRIGPNDVCKAVGVELRTLQNYFEKTINRPIATEIRRVRIERAKRELTQNKRPLDAIAHDVGFGNIQRFYEIFRREMGLSPSEYRKQHS